MSRVPSIEQQLADMGSLKYGHTTFDTGNHASGHMSKEGFLANPRALYHLADQLVQKCAAIEYDFVAGPVNFGYMFASYCALAANKPCTNIFLPTTAGGYDIQKGRLHRDFTVPDGRRALLIDDWAVSGKTLYACEAFMESRGIAVGGIGIIGANRQVASDLEARGVQYLLELPFEHTPPERCQPCGVNEPIQYANIRE